MSAATISFVMTPTSLMGVDPYTQAVYKAIKSHFPRCFPSIQRVATLAGCSHVTVIRRIKALVNMGALIVTKGRRGQSNRYEFPDSHLTPAEREAKRKGSWKTLSWKSVFFGSKKAVNHSTPACREVINPRYPNKTIKEQECHKMSFKEAAKLNPDLVQWMKP